MFSIIKNKKMLFLISIILINLLLMGCNAIDADNPDTNLDSSENVREGKYDRDRIQDGKMGEEAGGGSTGLQKGKSYSSKNDVADYIYEFGELPPNYITKKEAEEAGWDKSEGNLWEVTRQKSIGGDYFGNREGLLPDSNGRKYFECDINYEGGYRGAERLVFSNDGLIFYTGDHYESFEQLY